MASVVEIETNNDSIAGLIEKYQRLSVEDRIRQIYEDFPAEEIMASSSFAANSAYFLHLISQFAPHQTIYFINTGYHFPQTLEYKERLTKEYNLKVVDIHAEKWKHDITDKEQMYKTDPDYCCTINKIEPFDEIKKNYKVWISSVMRWQTEHRAELNIFEERGGILKFYPMIDVTKEQRAAYIREHKLPFHPLVAQGYASIGCTHCTRPGDDRSGRWVDSAKSECGIHL